MHPPSRIIFYGTPVIAVESLKALVEGGFHVSAAVTAPDKPAGRGMKLKASAVKEYAVEMGIPVLQPEKLSDPGFLEQLTALKPDLQVVVAFRMMPRSVWALPPLGTFNLHASLLPQYRGAAPINWAIINGETRTGLTTFFLQDKVDTGEIIFRESMDIGPEETAGELHDRMKTLGATLVIKTVKAILSGPVETTDQLRFTIEAPSIEHRASSIAHPASLLKPAPKITTETCRIDWNMPSATIINLIRGLNPVPGAFTHLTFKDGSSAVLKIFKATADGLVPSGPPGCMSTDGESRLVFSSKDADVCIHQLQLAGRKPMETVEFLRGFGRNLV